MKDVEMQKLLKIIDKTKDDVIKNSLIRFLNLDIHQDHLVGYLIEYLRNESKISDILFYDEKHYPNSPYKISIKQESGSYSHSNEGLLDALFTFLEENM